MAKLDLVDANAAEAVPVEYKRGHPPAQPCDRVQLAAQALVLRENGWKVERGFLYYAETREKVEVNFDEELFATTRAAVSSLREMVSHSTPPPPLLGSPKCVGCSLAGICLPDELCSAKPAGTRNDSPTTGAQ